MANLIQSLPGGAGGGSTSAGANLLKGGIALVSGPKVTLQGNSRISSLGPKLEVSSYGSYTPLLLCATQESDYGDIAFQAYFVDVRFNNGNSQPNMYHVPLFMGSFDGMLQIELVRSGNYTWSIGIVNMGSSPCDAWIVYISPQGECTLIPQ